MKVIFGEGYTWNSYTAIIFCQFIYKPYIWTAEGTLALLPGSPDTIPLPSSACYKKWWFSAIVLSGYMRDISTVEKWNGEII